jgi:hypothetical protein
MCVNRERADLAIATDPFFRFKPMFAARDVTGGYINRGPQFDRGTLMRGLLGRAGPTGRQRGQRCYNEN